MRLVVLAMIAGVLCACAVAQEQQPMRLRELVALPRLNGVALSPAGDRLLYLRSDPDWDKDRMIAHIWRAALDGSDAVQMTNGAEGETGARWSPDGLTIAFRAKRGSDEDVQIYLIRADGGEARRLTAHATAVEDLHWSRDGQHLYFLAEDPKTDEQTAREALGDDIIRFEEKPNQHLWRVAVDTGVAERLTEGDFHIRTFSVSHDGSLILHDRFASPLLDDLPTGDLWVLPAEGGKARQVTKNNQVYETGARLAPDNRQILYVANANAEGDFYYNDNLFTVPVAGGAPRLWVPDLPYEIRSAEWRGDGQAIVFRANMGVRDGVLELDLSTGTAKRVFGSDATVTGWDYDPQRNRHLVQLADALTAGDLYLAQDRGQLTRITRVYEDLATRFDLPRQEIVRWRGEDGVMIEGILTYPLDYQDGQPVPLIVNTHGGPASTDQVDGFSVWEYLPVAAAHGYAVLRPNYRGSTGYGDEFLRDMVGSYFNQSHKDVLTGVDALIERGIADPDRLIKMGWSAGGHMTNKIITATDRFAAASSGAGAVNWISMYGQSDIRIYRTPWFGGTPWQEDAPIDVYLQNSPLVEIHKVTTPTLVLVGEKDERVPPPQSLELYRALKSLGVPTTLYLAPDEPHGWRTLRHRLFKGNVELDWFATHALGQDYIWETPPEPQKPAKTGQSAAE
ncbi:MAG: prolyl oligopeptidase family serine peptidase [Rhodothalassiaceae bacterium]